MTFPIDIEGWHPIDARKTDPKDKDRNKERIDLALTMRNAHLDERFVFGIKRFELLNLVTTSLVKGVPVTQSGFIGLFKSFVSETVYGIRNMEDTSGIPFFVTKEKFNKLEQLMQNIKVAYRL